MPDDVTPLANAFRTPITSHTVLIERFYNQADGSPAGDNGTGIIGNGQRDYGTVIHIATAAHVIDDTPTRPIRWRLSRLERSDNGNFEVHVAEFFTQLPGAEEAQRWYRPAYWQLLYDIGMVSIINRALDPDCSYKSGRPFIDISQHPGLS